MFELVVNVGKQQGKRLQLPLDREILIGRDPSCQIVLNSALISRQHCSLRHTPEGIWAQDLNSQNGSYVNDVAITEPTLMAPGDLFRIGAAVFVIESLATDVPTSAAAAAAHLNHETPAVARPTPHPPHQATGHSSGGHSGGGHSPSGQTSGGQSTGGHGSGGHGSGGHGSGGHSPGVGKPSATAPAAHAPGGKAAGAVTPLPKTRSAKVSDDDIANWLTDDVGPAAHKPGDTAILDAPRRSTPVETASSSAGRNITDGGAASPAASAATSPLTPTTAPSTTPAPILAASKIGDRMSGVSTAQSSGDSCKKFRSVKEEAAEIIRQHWARVRQQADDTPS